jgi:hypothetical protein
MVDSILYAIASILSAITTTILSRVHTIVNPQAVSQDLLGQCQTADCNESSGQQSAGSVPAVGHNHYLNHCDRDKPARRSAEI